MSAPDDSHHLNAIIWSIFWRFMLVSSAASLVASFAIAFVLEFAWAIFVASQGADRTASNPVWLNLLIWVLGFVAGLVIAFRVLYWAIETRIDKVQGGTKLSFVRVMTARGDER